MFKKRKKQRLESVAEQRFDDMMDLIKDLPKRDYEKLKEAMDLGYSAYQKVKNVKSEDEKEFEDINQIDKVMTKEREARNGKVSSIKAN